MQHTARTFASSDAVEFIYTHLTTRDCAGHSCSFRRETGRRSLAAAAHAMSWGPASAALFLTYCCAYRDAVAKKLRPCGQVWAGSGQWISCLTGHICCVQCQQQQVRPSSVDAVVAPIHHVIISSIGSCLTCVAFLNGQMDRKRHRQTLRQPCVILEPHLQTGCWPHRHFASQLRAHASGSRYVD